MFVDRVHLASRLESTHIFNLTLFCKYNVLKQYTFKNLKKKKYVIPNGDNKLSQTKYKWGQ